ncbi:hypothetical protein JOM56_007338 [Amanita muscaria]
MSLINPPAIGSGKGKGRAGGAQRNDNNRIYAYPLPILFEPAPLQSNAVFKKIGLDVTTRVFKPQSEAIFDEVTRSVWVTSREHSMLLWRRGFFGKGDLSRSEPTWLARQQNTQRVDGKQLTSEEMTARRRAERQQFKLDRAKAIAAVAEEAEVIFATEGRVVVPALTGPAIPSAATWRLNRPSKPDETVVDKSLDPIDNHQSEEDVEHLQLTLQEAFFLSWGIDCLTIFNSHTRASMTLQEIWQTFQRIHHPLNTHSDRFDNPFLIYYVAYHHYRSLGWVVKSGIKFCVDYLLYKRGPVFSHAEFAVVVCPVYEDPDDQATSPFSLPNVEPFTWSWLSTINRVNSQVQKTLILSYVTIPARSRVPAKLLESPACLSHYSVREVVLRRFIPARMRD